MDKNELGHLCDPILENSQSFNFDKVFTADKTNNLKFYNKAIKAYTKNLIKGKNSSIIVFGPSHSGKSFIVSGKEPS